MEKHPGLIIDGIRKRFASEEEIRKQAATNGTGFCHYADLFVRISRTYAIDSNIPYEEMQSIEEDTKTYLNRGKIEAQRLTGSINSETKMMIKTQRHLGTVVYATADEVSYNPFDWFSADAAHRTKCFIQLETECPDWEWAEATVHLYYMDSQKSGALLVRSISRTKRHAVESKLHQQVVSGDPVICEIVKLWPKIDPKTKRYAILNTKTNGIYPINARIIVASIFVKKHKQGKSFNPEKASGMMNPIDVAQFKRFYTMFMEEWLNQFDPNHPTMKSVMRSYIIVGLGFSLFMLYVDDGASEKELRTIVRELVYKLGNNGTNFVAEYKNDDRLEQNNPRSDNLISNFAAMYTASGLNQKESDRWKVERAALNERLTNQFVKSPEKVTDRMTQKIQELASAPAPAMTLNTTTEHIDLVLGRDDDQQHLSDILPETINYSK